VVRKGTEPKAQTNIIINGTSAWSPDVVIRAAVISEILSMRMRETLREDLGGTYGVGVGVSVERWPIEHFTASVSFGSAPERIDSLAQVALGVLKKFADEGPTRDEVAKVRENLLRARETALRQNGFWVNMLQSQAVWGDDPAENFAAFTARVRGVDAASVRALARIVLNNANLARFTLLPERTGSGQR
jgi:zinc protease